MKIFIILCFFSATIITAQTIPFQYGWPRAGSTDFGLYNSSPTIADIDNDGIYEVSVMENIVTSGSGPMLSCFNLNGSFQAGFPAYITFGSLQSSGSNEISAMGDVNGDGKMEIVFGDENGRVFAFGSNGQQIAGSPFNVGGTKETTTPALVDLTKDSILEIIITSYERDSPEDNGQLHVLTYKGGQFEELPGFPMNFGLGSKSSPVAGDLDGDDDYEIVFISNGNLGQRIYSQIHAIEIDGTYLPGFPLNMAMSSLGSTPTLYDINSDGKLEIVLRAMPENPNINGIYAYDYQGNLLPQFPFPIESGHPDANVAIADMDGDSLPEFAFGSVRAVDSGKVWVWDLQGNLLKNYPQKVFATWVDGSVALADVSGDSLPDVIAPTNDGLMYAFDKDGQLVSGFPLEAENVYVVKGFNTSPTVVDIDNDGDIEIFAGSLNKRVYGWDTPGISNKNIWSTFKGNAQRTGGQLIGYREPTGVKNNNYKPDNYVLEQNYPNPFNPSTKIRYSIPSVEMHGGASQQNVMLKVYDVLGSEIATLINEERAPGVYEVEFDGSKLSSGIYFYILTAGSFKAVNKMILMR